MQTPWGRADQVTKIETGVSWVSTPSHGGLMVALGAARKYLTPKAIEFGQQCGGYVAFEEDCAYAIAFFQNPQWKRFLDKHSLAEWECSVLEPDSYMGKAKVEALARLIPDVAKTDGDIRDDMRQVIEYWFPEFFGMPAQSCCIQDGCGLAFDMSIPETRPTETLKPFWAKYCPAHRLAEHEYRTFENQEVRQ